MSLSIFIRALYVLLPPFYQSAGTLLSAAGREAGEGVAGRFAAVSLSKGTGVGVAVVVLVGLGVWLAVFTPPFVWNSTTARIRIMIPIAIRILATNLLIGLFSPLLTLLCFFPIDRILSNKASEVDRDLQNCKTRHCF
ncbi:MAG TPA: hypothetical protein DCY88_08380 [Cyanobacteria bacterium UBA11372]|nr:hypothetical protein [Cyanobacteria bacterium UBA11372]